MNPDATLKQIRDLIKELDPDEKGTFVEDLDLRLTTEKLIRSVDSLDHWLSSGGCRPRSWQPKTKRVVIETDRWGQKRVIRGHDDE